MKTKVVSYKDDLLHVKISIAVGQGAIATTRLQFQKRLVTNDVFNRISNIYKELAEIMPELAKNSFDSFIDRMFELSSSRVFSVFYLTIEASHEKDILVVRMIDNGKPINLDNNGNPINRKRQKGIHFGGAHSGIQQAQTLLRTIGGKISWQALKDGTRTEVRIPATSALFSR